MTERSKVSLRRCERRVAATHECGPQPLTPSLLSPVLMRVELIAKTGQESKFSSEETLQQEWSCWAASSATSVRYVQHHPRGRKPFSRQLHILWCRSVLAVQKTSLPILSDRLLLKFEGAHGIDRRSFTCR